MKYNISEFHMPRWNELPIIDLYVDQVVTLVDDVLSPIKTSSSAHQDNNSILTKNMINNYVKNKIIEAPTNKKYNKKLVAKCLVICILKEVYKIEEIKALLFLVEKHYAFDVAYDRLCTLFEEVLLCIFQQRKFTVNSSDQYYLNLLKSILFACGYSIYTKKEIEKIDIGTEKTE